MNNHIELSCETFGLRSVCQLERFRMMWASLVFAGILIMQAHPCAAEPVADVPILAITQTLSFPAKVENIAWNPNGTQIAVGGGWGNRVYLYDLGEDRVLWEVKKNGPRSSCLVDFDPTGQIVITSSTVTGRGERPDVTLSLIDAKDGSIINQLIDQQGADLYNITHQFSLSSDRSLVAAAENTNPTNIVIYNSSTWRIEKKFEVTGWNPAKIAISKNKNEIIVALIDGEIDIYNYRLGNKIKSFKTINSVLYDIIFNEMNGLLITAASGAITGQRIKSGPKAGSFEILADDPSALVKAWNLATGKEVATYVGPGVVTYGLMVSADGRYVAATKGKKEGGAYLLIWDVASARLVGQLEYDKDAGALAFSPDGKRLAVAVGQNIDMVSLSN